MPGSAATFAICFIAGKKPPTPRDDEYACSSSYSSSFSSAFT